MYIEPIEVVYVSSDESSTSSDEYMDLDELLAQCSPAEINEKQFLLTIDVGIRNLAYCVAECGQEEPKIVSVSLCDLGPRDQTRMELAKSINSMVNEIFATYPKHLIRAVYIEKQMTYSGANSGAAVCSVNSCIECALHAIFGSHEIQTATFFPKRERQNESYAKRKKRHIYMVMDQIADPIKSLRFSDEAIATFWMFKKKDDIADSILMMLEIMNSD
jgi:hypothetical protein